MKIKSFEAKNFRNIKECKIEFSDGINLLIGKNAQGKTNVAEGIYLFSRGKSFRGGSEGDLRLFGSDGFYTAIEYESKLGKEKLEYSVYGRERARKKNGYRINKITDMIGGFKCVLFVPDDLTLVKGGPEERRNFLNVAASLYERSYIDFYKGYKVASENRNCILKNAKAGFYLDMGELSAWSDSVAKYAAEVCKIRREYLKKIEKRARKILFDISGESEELTLFYKCDIDDNIKEREEIEKEYKRILSSDISREIAVGYSLFGPSRDDIEIKINGKEARTFASQGQQRSIVLSIKLAEGEVIKDEFGEYPVFIFDDVMSELDEQRRKYIIEKAGEKQIIITSCESESYRGIADNIIEVSGGEYVSAHR